MDGGGEIISPASDSRTPAQETVRAFFVCREGLGSAGVRKCPGMRRTGSEMRACPERKYGGGCLRSEGGALGDGLSVRRIGCGSGAGSEPGVRPICGLSAAGRSAAVSVVSVGRSTAGLQGGTTPGRGGIAVFACPPKNLRRIPCATRNNPVYLQVSMVEANR